MTVAPTLHLGGPVPMPSGGASTSNQWQAWVDVTVPVPTSDEIANGDEE